MSETNHLAGIPQNQKQVLKMYLNEEKFSHLTYQTLHH
jgi:hypothetical protein